MFFFEPPRLSKKVMEAVQRQAVPVRDYLAQRHGYHFTIKAFLQTPRLWLLQIKPQTTADSSIAASCRPSLSYDVVVLQETATVPMAVHLTSDSDYAGVL